MDGLLMGTITEFRDDVLTTVSGGLQNVHIADFSKVTAIDGYAFYQGNISHLVLRNTQAVCSLGSWQTLYYSQIYYKSGYIYVPRTMADGSDGLERYKAATNWSRYASQFRALEDYTVDGTVTGELDESKI